MKWSGLMKDLVWAAYGFDIKGENIWFCSYWDNFLCCYSLAEKRVIRIEEIPEHGKQREFLFSNVAIVDTNLIALIPSNAASLFLYNIENRSFMEFPVDIPEGIHNKFCGYAKYNDYLYIFPVNCDVIIRLNLKSKEIHRISDWNNEIETTGSIMAFQMKNCICGENIFLISAVSNKIMRFRMSDESYQIYKVGKSTKYCTMTHLKDEKFLLSDDEGNCTITDLKTENYTLYENKIPNFASHRYDVDRATFIDEFIYNDKVYLIPGQANMIVEFSIGQKEIRSAHINDVMVCDIENINKKNKIWTGEKYSFMHLIENVCYGFMIAEKVFIKWNLDLNCISKYQLAFDFNKEDFEKIMQHILEQKIVKENEAEYMSLNNYIKHCFLWEKQINYKEKQYIIGESIYHKIKGSL